MSALQCSICEKHKTLSQEAGFVIFEDHDLLVSHMPALDSQSSVYAGYCFIEPKKHVTELHQLSEELASLIGVCLHKLSAGHKELLDVERTYFFKFADLTPHYHVHVYPRHLETPANLIGEAVRHWQGGPRFTRDEAIRFVEKMRTYFK